MWSSRQGNGSMHLCHIYCKIKEWIHGDDKSNMLIKIVHMCGKWMVEMKYSFYESLSLLDLDNMRAWLYISLSLFFLLFLFFMDIDVSIFFLFFLGHASWACHLFSLFFSIAHASIERYERERSLNMEFYFVGGWNMVANFQCRSLACGVHMILIKQVWKTSH